MSTVLGPGKRVSTMSHCTHSYTDTETEFKEGLRCPTTIKLFIPPLKSRVYVKDEKGVGHFLTSFGRVYVCERIECKPQDQGE